MESKKEIRRRILSMRDAMPEKERAAASERIFMSLLACKEYQAAQRVLAFVSYRSEVDTSPLLERCMQDKKELFVPRVCGKEMVFYRIFSASELSEGYKGILEPPAREDMRYILEPKSVAYNVQTEAKSPADRVQTEAEPKAEAEAKEAHATDLLLMPGAVFDTDGNRIGYGGGFYDRFLAGGFSGYRIALAFFRQIVPAGSFEPEKTDIKPDMILHENGSILPE